MSQIAYACVPVAFFLAYLPALAKNGIVRRAAVSGALGAQDYANNPRAAQEALMRGGDTEESKAKAALIARISGAHNNQLEGLPWFYAALLFAITAGVPHRNIDVVALLYVALRAVYIWLYITGTAKWKGISRSLCFFVMVGSCMYLMGHAAANAMPPA